MTIAVTKNAAYSTVAIAPVTPTAGIALTVASGEGGRFPATPFYATVWASGAQPVWGAGGATGGNFEIVQVTLVVADVLTIVRAQEGTTARAILVGDQIAETWTSQTFRNAQGLVRSPRSSNTVLGITDGGNVICATSAFTQTLTAAATLGAGWWCVVKNDTTDGTTVLVVDPNGAETIDGLTTATMYSGETRLIECDGANFTSQLLHGGYAKFTPTGGTFVVPAGIEGLDVVCVGSGGQGGGGASSVSTAKSGGAGGAGASVLRAILRASDFTPGGSVTVTVAAGATGSGAGGGAGAGANGSNGADGSSTSFGTALKAYGGGGGVGGSASSSQGGGGGSVANSAVGVTAGTPASSSASAIAGQSAVAATAGFGGFASEWGGAGGGGSTTSAGRAGGGSIYGGPGGGGGGAVSVANVGQNGGNGGANQNYTTGGSGGGGTGGATPTSGTTGAGTTPSPFCGRAGDGGGGGTSVAGANGRPGGIGAGGGGGGSSSSAVSSTAGATGGDGGPGECRVWYS